MNANLKGLVFVQLYFYRPPHKAYPKVHIADLRLKMIFNSVAPKMKHCFCMNFSSFAKIFSKITHMLSKILTKITQNHPKIKILIFRATLSRIFYFLILSLSITSFSECCYAKLAKLGKEKHSYSSHTKSKDILINKAKGLNAADDFDFESELPSFNIELKETKINDPYEQVNRKIYNFNDALDRYFLAYVARAYNYSVPSPVRKGARNFISNLTLPVSVFNSFAQGKVDNGLATLSTFMINSTLGLGGIFDVAGAKQITYNPEDLGQTLGYYGVGSGAYLMLPFLGPSTFRDFGGDMVDRTVNPLGFNLAGIGGEKFLIENDWQITIYLVKMVDVRDSLTDLIDSIRKDSFDPYVTVRSAYMQQRKSKIDK